MSNLREEAEKFYKEYVKDKGKGAITLNVLDIMVAFAQQSTPQIELAEKVKDDFAIGFAEWKDTNYNFERSFCFKESYYYKYDYENIKHKFSLDQLLEIYKTSLTQSNQ